MATEKEDFKLTRDEADRLRYAMKNEEFRKLLAEYAAEISDPKNKQRYEEDIRKLESERGMDVQFVNIKPGFVIKTVTIPDKTRVFINIGKCDLVAVATASTEVNAKGTKGCRWSIPYTITKPRDDMDNGKKCNVIDVGYHSDTMSQTDKDNRFIDLLIDTAIEGIEREHGLVMDRKRVKRLKYDYKGTPQPAIIRKKTDSGSDNSNHANNDPFSIPYPPLDEQPIKKQPHYTIVYSGEFDMQDYTYSQISNTIRRPRTIIVTINLPKLDSTKTVELDILEKKLILVNEKPDYHLELNLSYPVDDELATATFDKSAHNLIITLPVLPPTTSLPPHPFITTSAIQTEPEPTPEIDTEHKVIETQQTHPVNQSVKSDWSVNEAWECPPFSYRQNEDCISLVLHISVVKEKTMTSHFGDTMFHVTFKGLANNQTFTSYSFYVEFDGCGPVIKPDNCSINIGQENIVIIITTVQKDIKRMRIGTSPFNLMEKLLINDDNISEVIHQLTDTTTGNNGSLSNHTVEIVHCDNTSSSIVTMVKDDNTLVTGDTSDNGDNNTSTMGTSAENITSQVEDHIVTTEPSSNDESSPQVNMTGEDKELNKGCGHNTVQFNNDLLYDLD